MYVCSLTVPDSLSHLTVSAVHLQSRQTRLSSRFELKFGTFEMKKSLTAASTPVIAVEIAGVDLVYWESISRLASEQQLHQDGSSAATPSCAALVPLVCAPPALVAAH